jgi:hypothetical protein
LFAESGLISAVVLLDLFTQQREGKGLTEGILWKKGGMLVF